MQQVIEVLTPAGIEKVEAHVHGLFACYVDDFHNQDHSLSTQWWVLSHVPTGLGLVRLLDGAYSTQEKAEAACKILAREFNDAILWSNAQPMEERRANAVRARDALKRESALPDCHVHFDAPLKADDAIRVNGFKLEDCR